LRVCHRKEVLQVADAVGAVASWSAGEEEEEEDEEENRLRSSRGAK
jgi:hypothetical protein